MSKRFSQMSEWELQEQINDLELELKQCEYDAMDSQVAIIQQKIYVARSYQIDPTTLKTGRFYSIEDTDSYVFKLNYINGVFAWGNKIHSGVKESHIEEALPLALLNKEIFK